MIKRSASAAVSLAAVAVTLASPVSADPLDGSYTMTRSEPSPGAEQVELTPCGPDCTHWRYTAPGNGQGFDLHLHGNRWVSVNNDKFFFDKDSLQGIQGTDPSPFMPQPLTVPFTLTRSG